jgi:hypothetical protein
MSTDGDSPKSGDAPKATPAEEKRSTVRPAFDVETFARRVSGEFKLDIGAPAAAPGGPRPQVATKPDPAEAATSGANRAAVAGEFEADEGDGVERPTLVPKFDVEGFAMRVSGEIRGPQATITDEAAVEAARLQSLPSAPPARVPSETPPKDASKGAGKATPAAGLQEVKDPMDVLGSLSFVPRHIISVDQLTRMQLDHHAGFLLTLVDGVLSFETIIDVCGMPRADALRVLADLVRRGVIST